MGSVFTAYSAPMPTLLSHSTSSPSWSCLIAHMNIAKCFGETVYRVTCSRAKCQSLAHNSIPLCCGQIENNLNTTLDAHTQLMLCCTSPSKGQFFQQAYFWLGPKYNQVSPTPCCPVACCSSWSQEQGLAYLSKLIKQKTTQGCSPTCTCSPSSTQQGRQTQWLHLLMQSYTCTRWITGFTLQEPDLYQRTTNRLFFPLHFQFMSVQLVGRLIPDCTVKIKRHIWHQKSLHTLLTTSNCWRTATDLYKPQPWLTSSTESM